MAAGLAGNRTLEQCLKEIPHRQYLAMLAWLDKEWNRPSRSDWYLMQIAQEIHNKDRKSGMPLSKFKIPFAYQEIPKPEEVKKNMLEAAKAKWFGFVGLNRKKAE